MKRTIAIACTLSLASIVLGVPTTAAPAADAACCGSRPSAPTQVAFTYANNVWVVGASGRPGAAHHELPGRDDQSEVLARRQVDRVQRRLQRQRRRLRRAGRRRRAEAADVASRRRLRCRAGRPTASPCCSRRRARRGRRAARRASGPCRSKAASKRRWRCRAAFRARFRPTASHIAYRMNTSWDDERRNYRGGQNRPIWIVDLKIVRSRVAAVDRFEGRRSGLGRRHRLFHFRSRRRRQRVGVRERSRSGCARSRSSRTST